MTGRHSATREPAPLYGYEGDVMSYRDALYQSKRISIGALKTSSTTSGTDQEPPQPLENTGIGVPLFPLTSIPATARSVTGNPYGAPSKPLSFMEPPPDSDPMPPAPEFSYTYVEPTPEPSNAHHVGATRIYELAEKYVNVFQAHAASQMTPVQRHALIAEVATFYSAPFRAGRLEALVSTFEG